MKVFINTLLILIVVSAFLSTYWLGVKTDNYWPVIFILVVVGLYFFLTWSFKKGSSTLAVQQFSTNTLIALVFMGAGLMAIWLGISELSTPIHFNLALTNLIVNLIRSTFGSIAVSLLMWWAGGVIIYFAIGRLRLSLKSSQ